MTARTAVRQLGLDCGRRQRGVGLVSAGLDGAPPERLFGRSLLRAAAAPGDRGRTLTSAATRSHARNAGNVSGMNTTILLSGAPRHQRAPSGAPACSRPPKSWYIGGAGVSGSSGAPARRDTPVPPRLLLLDPGFPTPAVGAVISVDRAAAPLARSLVAVRTGCRFDLRPPATLMPPLNPAGTARPSETRPPRRDIGDAFWYVRRVANRPGTLT